jgi:MFS family permease
MAEQSKEAVDASAEKKKQRQLKLIRLHCFLNAFVSMLNYTTRTEILREICGGDFGKMAGIMSTWTGTTAVVEFLVNPSIGSLSDAYGRRPLMLMAPYFAVLLKTWVLINPSLMSITVEKMVCDGLRTITGTTMGSAAVSDLCSGKELAVETAGLFAALGASIVLGPLIGSQLSINGSYKLAIAAAAGQLYCDQMYLDETLTDDKKRPFTGFVNPFGVTKLFTADSCLCSVSAILALHNFVDMKIMADPSMLYQMEYLKWPRSKTQYFSVVFGLGMIFGRGITKSGMAKFGDHGHTSVAHMCMILGDLGFVGMGNEVSMWFRMLLGWYGNSMSNTMKAMGSDFAVDSGMGKGEYAGLAANMRAMVSGILCSTLCTASPHRVSVPDGHLRAFLFWLPLRQRPEGRHNASPLPRICTRARNGRVYSQRSKGQADCAQREDESGERIERCEEGLKSPQLPGRPRIRYTACHMPDRGPLTPGCRAPARW